jgi:hypothetical protein
LQILKGIALGLAGFLLFSALIFMGVFMTVNLTALNPQFAVKEIQRLDITQITREMIAEQIPEEDQVYLSGIEETLTEIKPWIDQQIDYTVNQGYDYLLGKTDTIELVISTEDVKPTIARNLAESYLQSPPEGFSELPVEEQELQVAEFQRQIMDAIPSTLEVNLNEIPEDARLALEQSRQAIKYIQTTFYILIVVCLILIAAIILIVRERKGITRSLGLIFLIDGILSLAIFLTLYYLGPQMITMNGIPAAIQTWIPETIRHLLNPLWIFSAIILVIGIILLVISFILFKKSPNTE